MANDIEEGLAKREEQYAKQIQEDEAEKFDSSDKPKAEHKENLGLALKNKRAIAKYLEGLAKEKQEKENEQEVTDKE